MEINDNQKWDMYSFDVFSQDERKDGGSQFKDAQYAIKNGVSKTSYIKVYNKAIENNIDIPTIDEFKEMKKSDLSLETYMNYKIDVKRVTQTLKDNGESIKDDDKINIILSNIQYSKTDKQAIYENYILDTNNKSYPIIKETGIDIDEYLKYQLQEFSSDKKDDGTISGKSVYGSGKKKALKYINSMNITYEQRLVLAGLSYSLGNKEQQKIFEYVNSLPILKVNKLDMLENRFVGFKVYKNGRVTW